MVKGEFCKLPLEGTGKKKKQKEMNQICLILVGLSLKVFFYQIKYMLQASNQIPLVFIPLYVCSHLLWLTAARFLMSLNID